MRSWRREFEQIELVPADTTDYSDLTVNPGTTAPTYTYRVMALNALGASNPATASPVSVIAGAKGKVSPTKLKFGTVRLTKTKTKTFTIKNAGKVNLQGTVLAPVTPFQIVTGAGPFTLLPKKSLKVTVRMAPQEAESYTGTITVLSTDTAKPVVSVELSGLAK